MTDLPHFDASEGGPSDEASETARETARTMDSELDEFDQQFGPSLAQLLRPPADLETRTHHNASADLMNRSLLGAGAELLTVGCRAIWTIFSPDDDTTGKDR